MTSPDLAVRTLGPPRHPSPLPAVASGAHCVEDHERILFDDRAGVPAPDGPSFELAGPRRRLFFDPPATGIGVVTCGGLCPGLNDVIRGLVMVAWHRYGVRRLVGFRYGLRGLVPRHGQPPLALDPEVVADIHFDGGTLLGSSRGAQDPGEMVDTLVRLRLDVLFLIGGDGTLRAARALAGEVERRGLAIAVVVVPKTIDNDIAFVDRSFGFETAYSEAVEAIHGAHNEARGAPDGVGLVKLMGRRSGYIACLATLATSHVNFCLVPEVAFALDGERGFLACLGERLERRRHAVVVVAEGAGQDLMTVAEGHDASGNRRLGDVGVFLAGRMKAWASETGRELNLKYIDPSYLLRSVPARPPDSVYCWRLAQHAVHAAMAGRTETMVGEWHGRLVHVPIPAVVEAGCRRVDPGGELWWSVLESTGQPASMAGPGS